MEGRLTISDDGFKVVTARLSSGLFRVLVVNGSVGSQGIVAYDVSTPAISKATTAADIEVTTGALNGTTGTDGKLVISAANDGKVYIENRLGSEINLLWKFEDFERN